MSHQLVLIEGQPALRESVTASLRGDGHEVWAAASGLQGLQAARSVRPDLVILDLNLPDMEGQVVCRILRGLASTTQIPIIVLHAKPDVFSRRFAMDCGAAGCLAKPFELGELASMVRDVLGRREESGLNYPWSQAEAAPVQG
jgi:DNA-binding response OmpR family regulator